jgi:hypothetical protein
VEDETLAEESELRPGGTSLSSAWDAALDEGDDEGDGE